MRSLLERAAGRLLPRNDPGGNGRCRRAPDWLVLCVNNVCNLECRMCDVGLGEKTTPFWANLIGSDPRNMTPALFSEVLRQASGFFPRPRLGFAYTEPLLHPRIVDFCAEGARAGFGCAITTNGTTLARHADGLVAAGLEEIVVSIDGPAEVHDRIRGGRETFRKIREGIEALHRAKRARRSRLPRLGISFAITDENVARVEEFLDEVAPFAPDRIAIAHLNFVTAGMAEAHAAVAPPELRVARSNLGPMEPAAFDLDRLFDQLARARARAATPGFPRLEIIPAGLTRAELDTFYRVPSEFVRGRRCADPWTMMMIRTDGTVIPAHGRCFDFPVGDLGSGTLPGIWNGERFVAFRKMLRDAGGTLPACARCCGVLSRGPSPQEAATSVS